MNEKAIFEHLFEMAHGSKDPRGVAAACILFDGVIIACSASSNDGNMHAENATLAQAGDALSEGATLYTTLEPCSKRSSSTNEDCVSAIIDAGIERVVFGARDPKHTAETERRLTEAGIEIAQTLDAEIVAKCAELFNATVSPEFSGKVELKPLD